MVIWGTVRSVKCKIGELPDQRNAQLGNCLVREISVEELSVRELAGWGTVSLVIFRESKTTWRTTLSFLYAARVRPQPWKLLIFSRFLGSKLLNGSLVVWPSNLYCKECSNFQDSKSIFMISDFNIFPIIFLRQLNFGIFFWFNNYFTFITKENLHFSLICSFCCFYCFHFINEHPL